MDTGERFRKSFLNYADPLDPNDPEFEAKVRMHLLPRDQPLVSRENAAVVGNKNFRSGLKGIYFGPNAPIQWKEQTGIGSLSPMPRIRAINSVIGLENQHLPFLGIYRDMYNLTGPEKWAIGIGAGASPSTFAHEFRHNATDKFGNNILDDANHLLDVIASPSKGAYFNNVSSAYSQLVSDQFWHHYTPYNPKYKEDATFAEKEKAVLDEINSWTNKNNIKHNDPEYKIPKNIFRHYNHNVGYFTGKPQEKYNSKNLIETSTGFMPRDMVRERAAYPFLNFIGSDYGPFSDPADEVYKSKYEVDESRYIPELDPYVQNKKPKKKASGGSVTMPDNYRKGGRVRML